MYILDKYRRWNGMRQFRSCVMRWAESVAGSDGSRAVKIADDYMALYKRKGLEFDEYVSFDFEHKPEEFRHSFLGMNEQRHYLDLLNPKKYYILARNKYLAHQMMSGAGICTSKLYAYYMPRGAAMGDALIGKSTADISRILRAQDVKECVVKTTESSHGESVWVFSNVEYVESDARLTRFDGKILLLSQLLTEQPLVFESVVQQTAQFSAWNASSVNTVRFMTTLWPDGSARVIATFIKIGRAGKCVDNAGGGGNVDACVDLETGEVKYAIRFDGWENINEIDCHPDSGVRLNGVVIDHWEEIKAEVCRFQQAFPWCKAAGWDIAITDQGPVVIEVNDMWDRTGQLFIRRGWRDEIRDCYLAWEDYYSGRDLQTGMGRLSNRLNVTHLSKIVEAY